MTADSLGLPLDGAALQARVAALEAELAAQRAEMQDFTYTVSHDLRASLRHILSYARMVQEDAPDALDEELRGFLDTIVQSAQHMGLLMDGLAELSRTGTAEVLLQPVALQPLLDDVCEGLRFAHPQRVIEWLLPPHLPEVQADARLLRQALQAVLDNAVKFTRTRAQASIHISAEADNTPGWLRLQVQDNGVGYNPALQAKLMKPFQRLHPVQQFEGIGMGLALARKGLQRMGARIEVQGTPDAGCCVALHLPLPPQP